jgi:hypothetical protein
MASNVELARQFYDHHQLHFQRVANEAQASRRWFELSGDQFDDWGVLAGHMPKRVRDANDKVERNGLTIVRRDLRTHLNRAARKGEGVVRAFSVEAKSRRWRVVLGEAFLLEQPAAIIGGVRTYTNSAEHLIGKIRGLLAEQDHMDDTDRTQAEIDISMAEFGMFHSLSMLEVVAQHIATGTRPNFRAIRQRMARALLTSPQPRALATAKGTAPPLQRGAAVTTTKGRL